MKPIGKSIVHFIVCFKALHLKAESQYSTYFFEIKYATYSPQLDNSTTDCIIFAA